MTEAEVTELMTYLLSAFGVGYGFGFIITAIRQFGDKI